MIFTEIHFAQKNTRSNVSATSEFFYSFCREMLIEWYGVALMWPHIHYDFQENYIADGDVSMG